MKIKKLFVVALAVASLCLMACLTACENVKGAGGNQMLTGSKTYYYALVYSQITETRYYHIQGWAEYGPEGGTVNSNYVGLELQLKNGDVVYRYEPNLAYELSKSENETYVATYGVIGD